MKKSILLLIGIFFILSILSIVVFAQSGDNTGVSVIILEEPTIFLGDDEHGNDTIDDDGEIWATLTTDPQVKNCGINWDDGWQAIDKTITSISHIYLSEGTKTVYYQCYDDNDNFVTVNDGIEIVFEEPECSSNADCDDSDPYTEDVCNNPGTVDSYCSYLPIICLMDNDCDDGNEYTEDICENPGTADSYCSYLSLVCLINNDCGTDGWMGSLTCSNDDVWQDYIIYACNNAGTPGSYCSDSTSPELKEDCGEDYCEDWEGNYCKLDDVYHSKTCHDKGCLDGGCFDDAYMEEEKVQECGISEYIGSNYCYDDDVYRDYITRGCSDSSCTESTSKNKIEECPGGCIDGRCKIEVCKTICNFGRCYEYCSWQ